VYVTGDITPDYLARLEVERNDSAKAQREVQRRQSGTTVVELL
jgi:hypothetical protein